MINVLFIAIEFAPLNTAGVYRPLKFIKYLQDFNINPIVVTLDNLSAINAFQNSSLDPTLEDEIPNGVNIYRIPCDKGDKFYANKLRTFFTIYFSIKDNISKRWKYNLFSSLNNIFNKEKPTVIISTLPPFSLGKLSLEISKQYNIPLIIDMRDGWSEWRIGPYGSYFHYLLTYYEEKKIFKNASAILATSNELSNIFKSSHPSIVAEKFHVIPNGYDSELSKFSSTYSGLNNGSKKIIIGYIGSFYYDPIQRAQLLTPWWKKKYHRILQYTPVIEDWLYRSPYYFFKTIKHIIERAPEIKNRIEIKFVGNKPYWLENMIQEFGLYENVELIQHQPYNRVKELLSEFDLVLCTSAKKITGNKIDWAIPSKIFDYIQLNKPILGFVAEGACKSLIESTNTGICFDPDNTIESAKKLKEIIMNGVMLKINKEVLEQYHRKSTCKKLSEIILSFQDKKDIKCGKKV